MNQYLSKEWNVELFSFSEVVKVYGADHSRAVKSSHSTCQLVLENLQGRPFNLFNKLIINDDYVLNITKKDNILCVYYPELDEFIPIIDKNKVSISLYGFTPSTIMKIDLVSLNNVSNVSYLYYIDTDKNIEQGFSSSMSLLNTDFPHVIIDSHAAVKTEMVLDQKIKAAKNLKDIPVSLNKELSKNHFVMLHVFSNKKKYAENHIVKSLNDNAKMIVNKELDFA